MVLTWLPGIAAEDSSEHYIDKGNNTNLALPPQRNDHKLYFKHKSKYVYIFINIYIQGVQILLNPTFPTFWGFVLLLPYFWVLFYLSYLFYLFLLFSYFSPFFPTFPTLRNLIFILILIFSTSPTFFYYFLADMNGKPNICIKILLFY